MMAGHYKPYLQANGARFELNYIPSVPLVPFNLCLYNLPDQNMSFAFICYVTAILIVIIIILEVKRPKKCNNKGQIMVITGIWS